MPDPKIQVDGREYELPVDPTGYTAEETVIVTMTTGLDFLDWTMNLARNTMQALLGMVAVAISRGNPDWTRDRVAEYVGQINVFPMLETLQTVAEADPGDPTPPDNGSPPSSGSSSESTNSAAVASAVMSHGPSGNQHSPTFLDSNHGSWER